MVIAETLVGIQLVKSSISGIRSVIDTCEDISQISHHIDNVFSGQEHVEKKIAAKKKPKKGVVGKWQTFIGAKLGDENFSGDGTSVQEIATEIIEKKQIEKSVRNMAILLNKRPSLCPSYSPVPPYDLRCFVKNEDSSFLAMVL